MTTDNLIYTDGHDVVVTGTALKVKNTQYTLLGITRHGLTTVKPARIPGILLIVVGVVLAVFGLLKLIPVNAWPVLEISSVTIGVNTMAMWGGILLVTIGLNINFMLKKRYAVRIATATGEQDVVISSEKAYIAQIVNALDLAMSQTKVSRTY